MIQNRLALWLLDRAPMWFRTRWPLRRYYWQLEEMAAARLEAERLAKDFGW